MSELLEDIRKYWTKRAKGYSEYNQGELSGEQREKWRQAILAELPDKPLTEIHLLDVGTGPGFFAIILAEAGIQVTAVLGAVFTDLFQIHGAVMESSESLLYAGYQHLNLTKIFIASIFLGSSGAVMDLSVDICSAVHEVVQKKPGIRAKEAIASGFAVGRAACGSTTTTLLLAYSGSYIALLMVFMAQGTPVELMLNYKYVAAEIVHTIVGSFGLVTVAPLTAITSGWLLTRGKRKL